MYKNLVNQVEVSEKGLIWVREKKYRWMGKYVAIGQGFK